MTCYNTSSIFLWYWYEGRQYHLTRMEPPANTIYMSHTTTIGQQSWLRPVINISQSVPQGRFSDGTNSKPDVEMATGMLFIHLFHTITVAFKKAFQRPGNPAVYNRPKSVKYFHGKCSHYRYIARPWYTMKVLLAVASMQYCISGTRAYLLLYDRVSKTH